MDKSKYAGCKVDYENSRVIFQAKQVVVQPLVKPKARRISGFKGFEIIPKDVKK